MVTKDIMTPLVALLREVRSFYSILGAAVRWSVEYANSGFFVCFCFSTWVLCCLPSKHPVGILFLFLETLISHR